MSVLMVMGSFPPVYAGAVVQGLRLSDALNRKGVSLEIIADARRFSSSRVDHKGINVHLLGTAPFLNGPASKIREMIYLIRSMIFIAASPRFKVIFLHSVPGFTIFLIPWVKILRRKVMVELTLAGDDDPIALRRRRLGVLYQPAMKQADAIVAISSRLEELCNQAGINGDQLKKIPVGVDKALFLATPKSVKTKLRSDLGFDEKTKIFIAVGNIEPRKQYEFMIDAWGYISKSFSESVLLIIGPGNRDTDSHYRSLCELAKQESISNLRFIGQVDNVNEYMQTADYLLHCALQEGLPNTLLEAAFSSLPIICRRMPGITSDIIRPGIGFESDAICPKDFARDVVAYSMNSPARSKEAGAYLDTTFSMDSVSDKYAHLIGSLQSI